MIEKKIKEDIIDTLVNHPERRGVYKLIINSYLHSINELDKSGYNIRMIFEQIEKDLNIEKGKIKYKSLYKALEKHRKNFKGEKKTISIEQKLNNNENDFEELDKINLNIITEKSENMFDKHLKTKNL